MSGVGERAGVRSQVGEDIGTGQQWQWGPKARIGAGSEVTGFDLGRALKQDSVKATRCLGSRRGLLAHHPFASQPPRPSAALLALDPLNSPKGEGSRAGVLPSVTPQNLRLRLPGY